MREGKGKKQVQCLIIRLGNHTDDESIYRHSSHFCAYMAARNVKKREEIVRTFAFFMETF